MKTMELLVVIAFLVAIGPLALVAGADSRPKDTRDTTRWFPSSR
jgi:hypothetical protein